MRIIGGAYRGKNLYSPQNEGVRPTADRAREAGSFVARRKIGGFVGYKLANRQT